MPSGDLRLALREATAKDEPFLRAMGWFASHWRDASSPPEQIRLPPELSKYVDSFGRLGDRGFIAIWQGSPVGAAWYRLFERRMAAMDTLATTWLSCRLRCRRATAVGASPDGCWSDCYLKPTPTVAR